jgi:hypothetical protein
VGRGLDLKVPAPPSITVATPSVPAATPAAPAPAALRPEILSSEPEGFAASVLGPEATAAPPAAQPHAVESRVASLEALHGQTVALMERMVQKMEGPAAPAPETPDAMAELVERLAEESPELRALADQVVAQGKELSALRSERAQATAAAAEATAETYLFDNMTNLKAVYPSLTVEEGRAVAVWFLDPKNHNTRAVLNFREIAGRALGNDVLESRRFTAGSPAPPKGAKPVPAASSASVVTHSVPGAGAVGAAPTNRPENIREAVAVILRDHAADLGRYG